MLIRSMFLEVKCKESLWDDMKIS